MCAATTSDTVQIPEKKETDYRDRTRLSLLWKKDTFLLCLLGGKKLGTAEQAHWPILTLSVSPQLVKNIISPFLSWPLFVFIAEALCITFMFKQPLSAILLFTAAIGVTGLPPLYLITL